MNLSNASQYILAGQSIYTLLADSLTFETSGSAEVFCDTSALAIAIAASSDLDLVRVEYRDPVPTPNSGTTSLQFDIAPGAPFCGLITRPTQKLFDPADVDSENAIVFAPGRFFRGQGIYDWFIAPATFSAIPQLQLICYLAPSAYLPRARSPGYKAGSFSINGTDILQGRIPFYGRGLFHCFLDAASGNSTNIVLKIYGVRFRNENDPAEVSQILLSTLTVGAGVQAEFAFQNKAYDAIEILATGGPGAQTGYLFVECADLAIM